MVSLQKKNVSNMAEVYGIKYDKITYSNESKQVQKFRVRGNTIPHWNANNCVSQGHLYTVQCKGISTSVVNLMLLPHWVLLY
jgi:hypothetical protein